jgi:hypothetical protein
MSYRTIKIPIRKVLRSYDVLHPIITRNVLLVNEITTRSYELLKLHLLHYPKTLITRRFMTDVFNLIGSTKPARNQELQQVYDEHFEHIYTKLDKTNLSHCLDTLQVEMIKCLETNIKTHFFRYQNRYVNETFDLKNNKSLKYELTQVKWDLNNGTLKSNVKYHDWIKTNKCPLDTNKVKFHPQSFLPYLIDLNKNGYTTNKCCHANTL